VREPFRGSVLEATLERITVAGRGVLGSGEHTLSEPVPCLPGGWQ
jgi:hypothetical protein